ncbi:MAG: hypothetical protein RBQ97_12515 [Acholeplasma sp.]|nr:hypothetical protein [Acholeplasma sp.]
MKKIGILLLAFILIITLIGCQKKVETSNLSDYGMFRSYTANTSLGYKVFPTDLSEVETVNDYYFLFKPILWVNPDIQIFLSCTYSKDNFENELNRISQLTSVIDGYNSKSVKYSESIFLVPAYYTVFAMYNSFEYALLDFDTNTIIYVSMQYQSINQIYFDNKYLPQDYLEVYTSAGEHELSYNMYNFTKEDLITSE